MDKKPLSEQAMKGMFLSPLPSSDDMREQTKLAHEIADLERRLEEREYQLGLRGDSEPLKSYAEYLSDLRELWLDAVEMIDIEREYAYKQNHHVGVAYREECRKNDRLRAELAELGECVPVNTGGTFKNDPPDAIIDAAKRYIHDLKADNGLNRAEVEVERLLKVVAEYKDSIFQYGVENTKLQMEIIEKEAEIERLKDRYEKPKQIHSCDIPGCVSCGNPDYEEQ